MLKETRSSYEVERERPSQNRIQRFLDLLRTAQIGQPLSQERFVALQNTVLEPRVVADAARRDLAHAAAVWATLSISNGKPLCSHSSLPPSYTLTSV